MSAPTDTELANAWKIHDAQVQWTSQVDSKASFVLAIETAVLAGVIELSGKQRRLSDLDDAWTRFYYGTGVVLLAIALIAVAWAVRPRLRNPGLKGEARDHFIYFGHARQWSPSKLASSLDWDLREALAKQIVEMAKIAWRKHVLLSFSISCGLVAAALLLAAAWTN